MGLHCAVEGCTGSTESKHRYPNPSKFPELFRKWLELCGNAELQQWSSERIYKNLRVCRKHFTEECFGRNNILLKSARPTLQLPVCVSATAVQSSLTLHDSPSTSVESVKQKTKSLEDNLCEPKPSTSRIETVSPPETPKNGDPQPSTSYRESLSKIPIRSHREALLSSVGEHSSKDLSPKAKLLYTKAYYYKRKMNILRKSTKNLRTKLLQSKKTALTEATSSMDRIRARFFTCQIENLGKRSRGRRYSLDDKVLALAFQKQSGSAYKFLSSIFDMPSRRTLQRVLNKVNVKPGLSIACFELFKEIKFRKEIDKYCLLMFDEMSITPHLQYNAKDDIVQGFENYGYRTTNQIANHVQVYMLRGISSKWKQPVYFNAVSGVTKAADITRILKLIVAAAQEAGLVVIATVCDQGSNNVSAIKSFISQTRANYLRAGLDTSDASFQLGNSTITPLFDPPHLLKGIRNNLLKNNLYFEIKSAKKVAKWDDIYTAYKMDPYIGNIRSMPRLTEHHVNPTLIKKMKVSICTRVFSNSVAKAINLMVFSETIVNIENETLQLPKSAMDTAECCDFFNKLFDSLNGSSLAGTALWRRAVTTTSGHIEFWNECIKVLKSMHFISNSGSRLKPPSLHNFIRTITNFKILFANLKDVGFNHMTPRTFNQDLLENFFGKICQRAYRNVNPTFSSFVGLYKSLLITNLTSKHSFGCKCEDDNSSLFFTLKNWLTKEQSQEDQEILVSFACPTHIPTPRTQSLKQVLCYISRYIVRKIKTCRTCDDCKQSLITETLSPIHHFTQSKQINKNKQLIYVNSEILNTLGKSYHIVLYILNNYLHHPNLREKIVATLCSKFQIKVNCVLHNNDVQLHIYRTLTKTLIHNYVKQLNNIMSGKDLRKLSNSTPTIFKQARNIYIKRRKK